MRHETTNKQSVAWAESMRSYARVTVDKFSSSQSKLLERNEEKDLDFSAHLALHLQVYLNCYCQAFNSYTPTSHRLKALSLLPSCSLTLKDHVATLCKSLELNRAQSGH